jgi:hypothetical protein|tara:strand:+ start:78 stop:548 length:471 start_codon:yes stop_codon:yes gene_type:complete
MTAKTYILAAAALVLWSASAGADERYRPVSDERVRRLCGECHMVFQPQMLPKRSWHKLMDGLADHFGEDASLEPGESAHIRGYLVAHAADARWLDGRFMRGIADNVTPLRISETPHWLHEHDKELSPSAYDDPKVKSKANCPARHRRAAEGDYDDD